MAFVKENNSTTTNFVVDRFVHELLFPVIPLAKLDEPLAILEPVLARQPVKFTTDGA